MAQRTVIFADEGNVLGSLRVLNRRPDRIKLRDYLVADSKGRQLVEMILYVGLPPNMPEFQDRRTAKERFLYWAETNGFLVVRKDGSPTEEG